MNETLASSSEWMQLYQQTTDSSFAFADATAVTTSCVTSTNNDLSPSSPSSAAAGNHLTPKGSVLKPIRRRSRASKRTPTTLLNTDANNFRSLVQQFTGCRRRCSTSISFGNTRGPVNINFAPGAEHDYRSCSIDHASLSQPFVETSYCPLSQLQQQEKQQQHYQQLSSEEQECKFSFDSISTDDFLLTSSFPRSSSASEIPQGLVMDDMYFLA